MLLEAARAYMYEVARETDAVREAGERPGPSLTARRRLANVNAVESATMVVDLLYAIAGTSAIYEGNLIERCARDVRTVSQHLVAAPSNVEMVGQFLLTGEMAVRR
jgi:alkylation response protein AidB-like acyl-CoA dehydrogenase